MDPSLQRLGPEGGLMPVHDEYGVGPEPELQPVGHDIRHPVRDPRMPDPMIVVPRYLVQTASVECAVEHLVYALPAIHDAPGPELVQLLYVPVHDQIEILRYIAGGHGRFEDVGIVLEIIRPAHVPHMHVGEYHYPVRGIDPFGR